MTTAWFGSFSQSAVHFDQSVHFVKSPVIIHNRYQEDKPLNHLCMARAHHSSYPPVSRCQRREGWRRICPDESECRFFAPGVFPPRRRSRCSGLFPPSHQTQKALVNRSQINLCLPLRCYLCNLWFHTAPPERADTQLLTLWYHPQAPCTLSQPLALHRRRSSSSSRSSGSPLGLSCRKVLLVQSLDLHRGKCTLIIWLFMSLKHYL